MEEIIKYFAVPCKEGTLMFEFFNKTKKEIFNLIHEMRPLWSQDVIDKIVNNGQFYQFRTQSKINTENKKIVKTNNVKEEKTKTENLIDVLHNAKREKNDEFYTRLEDIEKELRHYKGHFKDKVVYCNCDKFNLNITSNFYVYFTMNFRHLGLKKLICSYYNEGGHGKAVVFDGIKDPNRNMPSLEEDATIYELNGNGSYNSAECLKFLAESDIVVTNPPFSLFREYVATLIKFEKKFLIIGNVNAITYKEVFPLIRDNQLWLGMSSFNVGMYFEVPNDYQYAKTYKFKTEIDGKKVMRVSSICWFTNLDNDKRHEEIALYKEYNPTDYPTYDNYEAIECGKVNNIPCDYDGVIGVPITFLNKYNPNQFEIIGGFNGYKECDYQNGLLCGTLTEYIDKDGKVKTWTGPTINKKTCYYRILIRRKR